MKYGVVSIHLKQKIEVMSDFWLYFNLGFDHVLDWSAYDHLLFMVVLCAAYSFAAWKRVLLLVTLFTLGHTLSLFLGNFGLVSVSGTWIEFLIPVTILVTALYNMYSTRGSRSESKAGLLYFAAVFFGIIHGFGFARYFNQISDEQEILPLLEFALGIEAVQILVVVMVLFLGFIGQRLFGIKKRDWILIASSIVIGLCIPMLADTWPFGA